MKDQKNKRENFMKDFLRCDKKNVRAITGKYLSFPLLQDYIANLKADREVELFALAFLFKGLRGEKNESWNRLADRFFKVYSDELYRYCGYETETPGFARVWVARPDLFMVYMGAMMRAGIIEDCSFARMAGHVDRIFDTGNTENTVLNKLKEQLPEADSIVDGMKAEFKNFNHVIKINRSAVLYGFFLKGERN